MTNTPIPQTVEISPDELILTTQRLTVRPLRKDDYEAWRDRYSTLPEPPNRWTQTAKKDTNIEHFQKKLAGQHNAFNKDTDYNFAVFVHTPSSNAPKDHQGAYIGFVQLMDVSRRIFQNAYLGYSFFPQFWRQGYAQEACRAVIQCAFSTVRLHRVEAGIDPDNTASRALAERLGLRLECISPKRIYIDDGWRDMCLYSTTSETWLKDPQHRQEAPKEGT